MFPWATTALIVDSRDQQRRGPKPFQKIFRQVSRVRLRWKAQGTSRPRRSLLESSKTKSDGTNLWWSAFFERRAAPFAQEQDLHRRNGPQIMLVSEDSTNSDHWDESMGTGGRKSGNKTIKRTVREDQASTPSLLTGKIFDTNGVRFTPTHAVKNGKRYRYYTSQAVISMGW